MTAVVAPISASIKADAVRCKSWYLMCITSSTAKFNLHTVPLYASSCFERCRGSFQNRFIKSLIDFAFNREDYRHLNDWASTNRSV